MQRIIKHIAVGLLMLFYTVSYSQYFIITDQQGNFNPPFLQPDAQAGTPYTFKILSSGAWNIISPSDGGPIIQSISPRSGGATPSTGTTITVTPQNSIPATVPVTIQFTTPAGSVVTTLRVTKQTAGEFDCSASPVVINATNTSPVSGSGTLTLKTGGSPISLKNGHLLGRDTSLGIEVRYTGPNQTFAVNSTNSISVSVTSSSILSVGIYPIPLDQVTGVNSKCTVIVNVKAGPSGPSGTLSCSGIGVVNATVGQPYSSTGSVSLTLQSSSTPVTISVGQVLGSYNGISVVYSGTAPLIINPGTTQIIPVIISGTPITSGTGTLPISLGTGINSDPNCSISVIVGAKPKLQPNCPVEIEVYPGEVLNGKKVLIPYTLNTGSINLTDGTILGTAGGFTVLVDGNQTLTSPGGNINIKINGNVPSTGGDISIPINIEGESCTIVLKIVVPTAPSGYSHWIQVNQYGYYFAVIQQLGSKYFTLSKSYRTAEEAKKDPGVLFINIMAIAQGGSTDYATNITVLNKYKQPLKIINSYNEGPVASPASITKLRQNGDYISWCNNGLFCGGSRYGSVSSNDGGGKIHMIYLSSLPYNIVNAHPIFQDPDGRMKCKYIAAHTSRGLFWP